MVHIRSVRRQAQSLQRWIQAKMCYQGQPLPFLLPLTNIFFKLYFKNSTPLVAYGDASLNPWLAEGSVQHPYVLTFPQIFQTPRRVFLSHLSSPTFLPSSTTSSVASTEAADQLIPEKLCFLPTSSLQLRQMKTPCQSLKLKQRKASSPFMQLQQFQQMKVFSPSMQLKHMQVSILSMLLLHMKVYNLSMQLKHMKVYNLSMQLKHMKVYNLSMQRKQQMKAHKEETKEMQREKKR